MNTWPNRGASGGPCGGQKDRRIPEVTKILTTQADPA
jgi:hypothetical protein